jgi:prephenate dehydrogenase
MHIHTLTIVGVGLIGGSIGLAAKRRGLADHVIGAGRQQNSLDRARMLGAIDEGVLDLATAVHRAQLTVFCTPTNVIAQQVLSTTSGCQPGTLLTDAGSTKGMIVRAVESQLPKHVAFVGGHPLAGSEKRGAEFADAELFQDRLTVLTPSALTDAAAVERTASFWRSLGARIRLMDPDEHDQALAVTSHLPHLIASTLAGILPPQFHDLTASGFRDTTRVASGDSDLWTAIFAQNREAVLAALARFTSRLEQFRMALRDSDTAPLNELLAQAKKERDALGS